MNFKKLYRIDFPPDCLQPDHILYTFAESWNHRYVYKVPNSKFSNMPKTVFGDASVVSWAGIGPAPKDHLFTSEKVGFLIISEYLVSLDCRDESSLQTDI